MAVLGDFRKDGENYTGSMRTLGIDTSVTFEAVERSKDKQPTHRAYVGNSEIGAGWEKVSEKGNTYMSFEIDDPSFAKPLNGALISRREGEYSMVWERPKSQDVMLDRANEREQRVAKEQPAPSQTIAR